ncbi:MAG TPA: ImmA/IrrE family metallo-endopeptidase [Geminicoccaceae bacterium]|nr:ImmA/IrrE family metallo-endopeptidase [Geminicoccaceae bacterium]
MTAPTAAEAILQSLGITEPAEIDLEAIAWTLRARVRYRPLDGCEARIIGNGDQAIITVNSRNSYRRQRFSLGHELGHWQYHRGRLLVCRANEIGGAAQHTTAFEKVADAYAADLLMPGYLFQPVARAYPKLTFQTVQAIADLFDVSRTATAIRLVEGRHSSALLVCHGPQGRKWFSRSPDVPERWFPRDNLDPESFAFGVLFGEQPEDRLPRRIGADAWFDRSEAERYEVHEQTIRTASGKILTLVLLSDEDMLEDWGSRCVR